MAEEKLNEGQGGSPPQAGQEPEPVFEIGTQKVPLSELQKTYAGHKEAIRAMNSAQEELAKTKKELESYRTWADPALEAYNRNPDFRAGYEELVGRTAVRNTFDPIAHRLEEVQRELSEEKMERRMEKLSMELQAQGLPYSEDHEKEILRFLATNQDGIRDPKLAYRALFFDKAVDAARKSAVSATAERLDKARAAYRKTPSGSPKAETPPNLRGKGRDEKLGHFLDRYGDADFGI